MDTLKVVNQREPVEVIGQRPPVVTEPIVTIIDPEKQKKKEEKVKKEHVKKEKKNDKVYTKDDSCINMPFYESIIVQDSNPLWVKIPGVAIGESSQFAYKSVPCTKVWELLDTIIEDLSVTVINYNAEAGVAFFKTGFDINVKGDVIKNPKYTSFVLKSKLVGNPFVKE
jgi:hypothetical protein